MTHPNKAALFALIAAIGLAGADSALSQTPAAVGAASGDALTGLQEHRIYPHVERAQRRHDAGRYGEAAAAWRAALRRAPDHPPLIRGLALSLAEAGDLDEAMEWAEHLLTLSDNRESQAFALSLREELQLRQLASGIPEPAVFSDWLENARLPDLLLYRAVSRKTEQSGLVEAIDWLASLTCRSDSVCELLAKHRLSRLSQLAQTDGLPDEIDLADLGTQAPLTDQEKAWQIEQLLRQSDTEAALAQLSDIEDPLLFQIMASMVIQAGLEGDRSQADQAYERLSERGLLSEDQALDWVQLIRAEGDAGRALDRAQSLDLPCLDQLTLAVTADNTVRAESLLTQCDPNSDPRRWLYLAERLNAWPVIASSRFTGAAETLRINHLLDHYRQSGQDRALVRLATASGHGPFQYERAEAFSRLNEPGNAAAQWHRIYQSNGDLQALNRASFLWLQLNDHERALQALRPALPFADSPVGRELRDRTLALATLANMDDRGWLLDFLTDDAPPAIYRQIGALLGQSDECELIDNRELRGQLAYGSCRLTESPETAIAPLLAAWQGGLFEAGPGLALALGLEGESERALAIWNQLPADSLDPSQRFSITATTLASGELRETERLLEQWSDVDEPEWQRLWAEWAEKADDLDEALVWREKLYEGQPGGLAARNIAQIKAAQGKTDEELAWRQRAVQHAPGNQQLWLELAYGQLATDPKASLDSFQQATGLGPMAYYHHLQQGYLLSAQGHREPARAALREGIDGLNQILAEQADSGIDAEPLLLDQHFAARRSHERLGRQWEFGSSAWIASASVPGELLFPEQAPRNHLEVWANRSLRSVQDGHGSNLDAFFRLIGEGPESDALGNRAAVLGLRWQPWVGNLSLGAQWVQPQVGDGELVLTAATQQLDRGPWRSEWRPTQDRWWERYWYSEAAYWTRSEDYQIFSRFEQQRHWRFDERPGSRFLYGLAEAHVRDAGEDVRVGVGAGLRFHSGGSHYDAWHRRHTLKLEYHHALSTDLAADSGWFLRLESLW